MERLSAKNKVVSGKNSKLKVWLLKAFVYLFIVCCLVYPQFTLAQVRLIENFEGNLSAWEFVGKHAFRVHQSGDSMHNNVLVMEPDGIVYALIKDSDKWGSVRIEGDVLFPTKGQSYLGLIYNYTKNDSRFDFGAIYLKGNGSYLRANPLRDGNVSRLLYEEFKTPIRDKDKIIINQWHKFKAEIEDNMCHFYVGDMEVPKMTFGLFEYSSGLIGIKPRVAGKSVWVDNIKITSIKSLSYKGDDIPKIIYEPDSLLTDWEVIGPLHSPNREIELKSNAASSQIVSEDMTYEWKPFQTDKRGAVITGRITHYSGDSPVAYFRKILKSEKERKMVLHFSTVDEIALWLNGHFYGFIYRDGYMSLPKNDWYAWYDFWKNPEHEGRRIPIHLKAGDNQLLIRVRNGQYASGGFFLRLENP